MTKSMTKESIESPWRFRHFASTEQQTHSFYIGILPFKNREEPHCRLQCKGWTDSDTDAELKLIVNPFYHSYVLKKFFGIIVSKCFPYNLQQFPNVLQKYSLKQNCYVSNVDFIATTLSCFFLLRLWWSTAIGKWLDGCLAPIQR